MSDRDVSHAAVEILVNFADRAGLSLVELCEGLPIDDRRLSARLGSLDWELFVALIDRLDTRLGRERFLELFRALPELDPFGRSVLSRMISNRALLSFVCRVGGPSMFPMYETSYEDHVVDGVLVARLRMRLKDGFKGCQAIFEAHAVSLAAMPCFLGRPPCLVKTIATERGGEYELTLPS